MFELTKTSRESLLPAAYDCWMPRPTSSYTPPGASLDFASRGFWWGAVAARQWSAFVLLGVVFFRIVYPKFRPLQRLQVEAWTSAENKRDTDLKRLTASVD